ncbi:MAG: hypothetical protein Q6363_005305 [Candidatus Njordarchaeota archaeon]
MSEKYYLVLLRLPAYTFFSLTEEIDIDNPENPQNMVFKRLKKIVFEAQNNLLVENNRFYRVMDEIGFRAFIGKYAWIMTQSDLDIFKLKFEEFKNEVIKKLEVTIEGILSFLEKTNPQIAQQLLDKYHKYFRVNRFRFYILDITPNPDLVKLVLLNVLEIIEKLQKVKRYKAKIKYINKLDNFIKRFIDAFREFLPPKVDSKSLLKILQEYNVDEDKSKLEKEDDFLEYINKVLGDGDEV